MRANRTLRPVSMAVIVVSLPLLAACAVDSQTAERTGTAAAVGAASGAVVGLITGDFLARAATGAAAGAAGGFVYDQIEKNR